MHQVMANASLQDWLCRELRRLDIDASPDVLSYIMSMEEVGDVKEYMMAIMDSEAPHVHKFLTELLTRWPARKSQTLPDNIMVYKKEKDVEETYVTTKGKTQKKKGKKAAQASQSDVCLNGSASTALSNGTASDYQDTASLVQDDVDASSGARKKSKFVPLWSQEGEAKTAVRLPGRHPCECQASKHQLVGNCLKCGRVVCMQEGSGPCFYCSSLVCTKEEREMVDKGSKKGEKLRQYLMKGGAFAKSSEGEQVSVSASRSKESLEKALQNRDRLLEYDKTSVRRTKVIDDESDYFSTDTNKWLTKEQRKVLQEREEELRSKRFASRRDKKVTLDFAGRRVVEEKDDASEKLFDVNDEVVQQVYYGKQQQQQQPGPYEDEGIVNPTISIPAPQFVPPGGMYSEKAGKAREDVGSKRRKDLVRIQDRELLEMSDEGLCLSMHQPWASLLIKGIKIHEGRTWYSAHRGRLWIAATAKQPVQQEVTDVEDTYRYLKGTRMEFPSAYPVGCLLGCVDMVECLSQDDYRLQFPDGESASPFVFICENPRELIVKFPIRGKHKIYKLEPHIHQGAKKGLR